MTISIIIAAYNCEGYIERCLNSLVLQIGADLDIVVVNDGSTDGTGKVLEKYRDRVRVKTTENRGSSAARNAGIELAQGDYIMFLDSDDWLSEGTVERLSGEIGKTGADIVKFRYQAVYPDGRTLCDENQFDTYEIVEKPDFKKRLYPYFIRGIRLNSVWSGIYRAELIKGRTFREDMRVAEDAVFSLGTYTLAQKAVLIPDILYNYYQTGTGLTGSGVKLLNKYRCNFLFASETVKCLKAWGMDGVFTRIRVYLRPLFLTFDKIRRLLRSNTH